MEKFCGKTIDNKEFEKIVKQAQEDLRYGEEEKIIEKVFTQFPQNVDEKMIVMKIALIDMTNSTNLNKQLGKIHLAKLVEKIMDPTLAFDKRVEEGDLTLVSQLAKWSKQNGVNLFSFMSKYCLYHNYYCYHHDHFCIYDSIVRDELPYYISEEEYYELTKKKWRKTMCDKLREECNYEEYVQIMDYIIRKNGMKQDKIHRKMDLFLWYPNRASKTKNEKMI